MAFDVLYDGSTRTQFSSPTSDTVPHTARREGERGTERCEARRDTYLVVVADKVHKLLSLRAERLPVDRRSVPGVGTVAITSRRRGA